MGPNVLAYFKANLPGGTGKLQNILCCQWHSHDLNWAPLLQLWVWWMRKART